MYGFLLAGYGNCAGLLIAFIGWLNQKNSLVADWALYAGSNACMFVDYRAFC